MPLPRRESLSNSDREFVAFANSSGGRIILGATQKTAQKILAAMEANERITREELAALAGITADGVKYHIGNLRRQGFIERVGGRKEGLWNIMRKMK